MAAVNFQLRGYQREALRALQDYLRQVPGMGAGTAFYHSTRIPYSPAPQVGPRNALCLHPHPDRRRQDCCGGPCRRRSGQGVSSGHQSHGAVAGPVHRDPRSDARRVARYGTPLPRRAGGRIRPQRFCSDCGRGAGHIPPRRERRGLHHRRHAASLPARRYGRPQGLSGRGRADGPFQRPRPRAAGPARQGGRIGQAGRLPGERAPSAPTHGDRRRGAQCADVVVLRNFAPLRPRVNPGADRDAADEEGCGQREFSVQYPLPRLGGRTEGRGNDQAANPAQYGHGLAQSDRTGARLPDGAGGGGRGRTRGDGRIYPANRPGSGAG